MKVARSFSGVPYVWAGTSRSGVDCSGFTRAVLQRLGVSLPHNAGEQRGNGTRIRMGHLRPGDLLFFGPRSWPGHVGIYVGRGRFIHASSARGRVVVSDLSEYVRWGRPWAGARRLLPAA